MRKFEFFFLCISLLIVFSSFSVSYAHEKPPPPPFDPHNCSCLNQNGQVSASGQVSSESSAQGGQSASASSTQQSSSSQDNKGSTSQQNQDSKQNSQTSSQQNSSSQDSKGSTSQNNQNSNQNSQSSSQQNSSSQENKGSSGETNQNSKQNSQSSSQDNKGSTSQKNQNSNQNSQSSSQQNSSSENNNTTGQESSTSSDKTASTSQENSAPAQNNQNASQQSQSNSSSSQSSDANVSSSSQQNQNSSTSSTGQATSQNQNDSGNSQAKSQDSSASNQQNQNNATSSTTQQAQGSANVQTSTSSGQQAQANSTDQTTASSGQQAQDTSTGQTSTSSSQQAQGTSTGQTSTSSSQQAQGTVTGQTTASSSQQAQGTATGETTSTQQSQSSSSSSGSFKGQFAKVYAFGDSFTDTGNAATMEGVKSFVGQMFGKSSGQTAQSGRGMSNGRLLIDFLCDDLGLPSIQAYKDAAGNFTAGVNFAIAGSTCLSGDLFASHKITHSLMFKPKPESSLTEIDWFNKFLLSVDCKGKDEAQCKAHLGNSLFWVGALGLSDYARIFGSSISAKSLTEASVDHVGKILKALLERGAKYVVVQGLPPAGCCPLQLLLNPPRERDNMGCSSGLNAVIQAHNDFLQKKLGEVRAQYKDAVIVYADTWNAYKTVLVNYKNFQFEEPFKACCGAGGGLLNFDLHSLCGSTGTSVCKNPQSYISWDGIHFTEAMHKQLAQLFFHQGFCSPSFDALIEAKSKNGPAA